MYNALMDGFVSRLLEKQAVFLKRPVLTHALAGAGIGGIVGAAMPGGDDQNRLRNTLVGAALGGGAAGGGKAVLNTMRKRRRESIRRYSASLPDRLGEFYKTQAGVGNAALYDKRSRIVRGQQKVDKMLEDLRAEFMRENPKAVRADSIRDMRMGDYIYRQGGKNNALIKAQGSLWSARGNVEGEIDPGHLVKHLYKKDNLLNRERDELFKKTYGIF